MIALRVSLRAKLVLIAGAILSLAMAANTAVNGLVFAREYSEAVLSRAFVVGDGLTSQLDRLLALNIPVGELVGFEEQLQEALARHPFLSHAMVVSPGGEILIQSDRGPRAHAIADPEMLAQVRLARATSAMLSYEGERFYEVFTPVFYRGEHVATVRIGFPARFVGDKVTGMIWYSVAVTLLFAGLGTAALVVSLTAWVSRPLERFIHAGEHATAEHATAEHATGEGTPSGRTGAGADEMARLGETFDAVLADLRRQRSELLTANEELEREIAERWRAEEEIKASEAKYQDLYDNAPDMFASVDARTGRIQQCNRTLADSLGYAKSEIVGRPVAELHHPDCAAEVRKVFESPAHTEPARDIELRLRRTDGTTIDVSLNVSAVRDAGSPGAHRRAVWRDITLRKRAEEALRESEAQLRQASRLAAVGQLAAGVAHEINNPLAVIMGHASQLRATSPDPDVGARAEKMLAGTKRVARIVRELQNFARPKPPDLTAVQMAEVVERVVDLRQHTLAVSGILVEQDTPLNLPRVHGDPGQLEQVVLNLLLNAEQALASARGPQTGPQTITARLASEGEHVRLTVADTGPGIAPDVLPRIFDPFFTTKPVGQGTGLGLSICYGIVQAHHGRMWAESPPGRGATFSVDLPALRREEVPAQAPAAELPSLRPGHVLVVEDEPDVADVLRDLLGMLGQTVTVAPSGEAGWRHLNRPHASYDAVTLDVKMPDLSGPALWRRLIAHDNPLVDRVVFVTGDTVDPETNRFLEETGRPVLTKPVSLEALAVKLAPWLAAPSSEPCPIG